MIDFQWNGPLSRHYRRLLLLISSSYLLIIICAALMTHPERPHCYARIGLHALNVLPMTWLAYITVKKVQKLRKQGVSIFQIS